MKKIPTAQELGNKLYQPIGMSCNEFAIKLAIEFAKLHVEAALKEVAETNYPSTKSNFELVNSKILNSYPLDKIK
jgi:hypothetical protein